MPVSWGSIDSNEYTTDWKVARLPLLILALLGVISQLTFPSCDRYINPWLKRLLCPFLSQMWSSLNELHHLLQTCIGQVTRPGPVTEPSSYDGEGERNYDFLSSPWPCIFPSQSRYWWTGPLDLPRQIHGINKHMTHFINIQKRLLYIWKQTRRYFWMDFPLVKCLWQWLASA